MERDPATGEFYPDYDDGIPVGVIDEESGKIKIYNHLVMTVLTHFEGGSDWQRIVGFDIEPQSIHVETHGEDEHVVDNHEAEVQYLVPGETIRFSYTVTTVVSINLCLIIENFLER